MDATSIQDATPPTTAGIFVDNLDIPEILGVEGFEALKPGLEASQLGTCPATEKAMVQTHAQLEFTSCKFWHILSPANHGHCTDADFAP